MRESGMHPIRIHLPEGRENIRIPDALYEGRNLDLVLTAYSLTEDVTVEIDLLQVGKDGLTVLENGEGGTDAGKVIGNMLGRKEQKGREIDEGGVVDLAVKVFSGEGRGSKAERHLLTLAKKRFLLRLGQAQTKFAHIVEGIADLMVDAQCDEQVRRQIGIHVGVQIGFKLALLENVGFHYRAPEIQRVIFRLAHQCLGNGGDKGLALNPAVGVDVGHLGIEQAEDIELTVLAGDIAGKRAADDAQSALVLGQRKAAQPSQIGDKVAGRVIGRAQHVRHDIGILVQVELNDHVLFLVDEKLTEICHGCTSRFV